MTQPNTYTITLNSSLKELLYMARDLGNSKSLASFDFGDGRKVTFMCFAADAEGYEQSVQAYEDARDRYTTQVVNAVLADIEENGLPKPNEKLNVVLGAHSDNPKDYETNDATKSKIAGEV